MQSLEFQSSSFGHVLFLDVAELELPFFVLFWQAEFLSPQWSFFPESVADSRHTTPYSFGLFKRDEKGNYRPARGIRTFCLFRAASVLYCRNRLALLRPGSEFETKFARVVMGRCRGPLASHAQSHTGWRPARLGETPEPRPFSARRGNRQSSSTGRWQKINALDCRRG